MNTFCLLPYFSYQYFLLLSPRPTSGVSWAAPNCQVSDIVNPWPEKRGHLSYLLLPKWAMGIGSFSPWPSGGLASTMTPPVCKRIATAAQMSCRNSWSFIRLNKKYVTPYPFPATSGWREENVIAMNVAVEDDVIYLQTWYHLVPKPHRLSPWQR